MKKNLLMTLSFVLFLLFNDIAQATLAPPIPQICPSANAIRTVGVSRNVVQATNNGLWIAGRRNQKYGTNNNWTFVLGNIRANNVSDAYDKAVIGLTTLAFQLGPFLAQEHWLCLYNTIEGYMGLAVNPPVLSFSKAMSLAH